MTAGYPGDQGEGRVTGWNPEDGSLFEDRRPGPIPRAVLPGPANEARTVHLSWRSAWRVGVAVFGALVAFAATAVVVSAVAAAMLAQSVQP